MWDQDDSIMVVNYQIDEIMLEESLPLVILSVLILAGTIHSSKRESNLNTN